MKMFLLEARTAAVFQLMGPFDQVEGANYIFIGELIVVVKEAGGLTLQTFHLSW